MTEVSSNRPTIAVVAGNNEDLPQLDEVEQRVIGALLEKEITVPSTYPLTLNALRTACNQSSSREPVMDLDDQTILDAIDRLKARGLARMVYASSGARAVKYRQVIDERLNLEADERALLTILLLRGPQAPGELKTRTERLHHFDDRSDVEVLLAAMVSRTGGALVGELERLPSQHDSRWIHTLGPVNLDLGAGTSGAQGIPATSMGTQAPVDFSGWVQLRFAELLAGATPTLVETGGLTTGEIEARLVENAQGMDAGTWVSVACSRSTLDVVLDGLDVLGFVEPEWYASGPRAIDGENQPEIAHVIARLGDSDASQP